jgi:hypothetical protein
MPQSTEPFGQETKIRRWLSRWPHATDEEIAKRYRCSAERVRHIRNSLVVILEIGPADAEQERQAREHIERECERLQAGWTATERRLRECRKGEFFRRPHWAPPLCGIPTIQAELPE